MKTWRQQEFEIVFLPSLTLPHRVAAGPLGSVAVAPPKIAPGSLL